MAGSVTSRDMPIHTSLLWAHQIRRENVHLINRIDSLERTLSSATETALEAKHGVANLEALAQSLTADNKELRDELKAIGARLDLVIETSDSRTGISKDDITRLKADVEALDPRIRVLEDEEAGLRAGLSTLEMTCAAFMQDQAKGIADIKNNFLKEGKQFLKQELSRESIERSRNTDKLGSERQIQGGSVSKGFFNENLKQMPKTPDLGCSQQTSSSFEDSSVVIVPDSIPSLGASTEPTSAQRPSSIGGIDHEIDGAAFWEDLIRIPDRNTAVKSIAKTDVAKNLKQDKQPLMEYFSMAAELRSKLPRRKQEGSFVEAFWEGLMDENTKSLLEQVLDHRGWTWNALESLSHETLFRDQGCLGKGPYVQEIESPKGRFDNKRKFQDSKVVKVKKRKRHISLVPTEYEGETI